jgi:CheY-specific phosphatase CheX
MINGKLHSEETHLRNAFESGYSNAALSFSKLIADKISSTSFQNGIHKLAENSGAELTSFNRPGANLLLTTEVFGDVTGKSYLLLSEQDVDTLTKNIYGNGNRLDSLKDEYLKELDNILSASVITKLSDELGLKMYGDIPMLVGRTGGNINTIIIDDFAEHSDEVYVNAAFFTFENHPAINPFFAWVIDGNIHHILQEKSLIKKAS